MKAILICLDQKSSRDFVLTKICYAGSHFFGNVTYPKEVEKKFLVFQKLVLKYFYIFGDITIPKKTHLPIKTKDLNVPEN